MLTGFCCIYHLCLISQLYAFLIYFVLLQSCLIINVASLHLIQCVGEDVEDLEYTPKPEFEGYFKVTNVKNEVKYLSS